MLIWINSGTALSRKISQFEIITGVKGAGSNAVKKNAADMAA